MNTSQIIFWNVDTQIDFVEPEGKLYVSGAELLKPVWGKITELAAKQNIGVVNTADYHYKNSAELSAAPDFVSTFPEHCMATTSGAEYVRETLPSDAVVFDWDKEYLNVKELITKRNIVIRKDAFDVFAGNPYTELILKNLSPKTVVVYGVTTNVCVNDAVVGLAKRVDKVYVIEDAIKELPNIPLPFENWKKLGVKMIEFEELVGILE
ncbi:cysteine hydrolase [Prolixibacteraceae bacterium Z1-6]|uniref:Cysteine hydrolase n=1 Tax=Draconibacterium aestuarii TaxID=2998507 RepID=A0A9X3J7Z5_9BACT|nr:cysteine hydrolase [Prolixibacteraceae bacterium Z1-6]